MTDTSPKPRILTSSRITGTAVYYQPGMLVGGTIEHDCNPQRAIGYYLEALMCLAPFMKSPVRAILRGVTNDQNDPSVCTQCVVFYCSITSGTFIAFVIVNQTTCYWVSR